MIIGQDIVRWRKDNGDYTHNLNYVLNENSIVLDLGGYTGLWAEQIISKYNPHMFIVEPIEKNYFTMLKKFSNNPKVKILNVGAGSENKKDKIYLNNDASSRNIITSEFTEIEINTMENIFQKFGLKKVDLIQINIEGDEYSLLENMLNTNFIYNFDNIQVQFHLGIENCVERRINIQNKLQEKKYNKKFDYPFVWESWEKK